MSDEKRKRQEENRRRFEEDSRRRQQKLGSLLSRGSGRHVSQTLYPRTSTSQSTPPTDDSPSFQEFCPIEEQPASSSALPGNIATSRPDLDLPPQQQTERSVRPKVWRQPSPQVSETTSSSEYSSFPEFSESHFDFEEPTSPTPSRRQRHSWDEVRSTSPPPPFGLPAQQTEPSVRPKVRRQPSPQVSETTSSSEYSSFPEFRESHFDFEEPTSPPPSRRQRHPSGEVRSTSPPLSSRLPAQQTEPSVRPKVRKPLTVEKPSYENIIPEPDIVLRYRNRTTGEPDTTKLRLQNQLARGDPRNRALDLANLSRTHTTQITARDRFRNERKSHYLGKDLNFQMEVIDPDEGIVRYHPQRTLDDVISQQQSRQTLQPFRRHDRELMDSSRFNKPIGQMGSRQILKTGPVGRQGFGTPMRRSMSLPDLSGGSRMEEMNVPSPLEEYNQRYRRLPKEQRDAYKDYRKQINWKSNPLAKHRMVKGPTIMNIHDQDKERLSQYMHQRQFFGRQIRDRKGADLERRTRRLYIHERAKLDPSISDKKKAKWLLKSVTQQIPEESEEESEEEESEEEEEQD